MSDYLTDEEQLARLRGWWSTNGTRIVVALVLLAVAFLGWRWYQSERQSTVERSSDLYAAFLAAAEDVRPTLTAELDEVGAGTTYPALAQLSLARAALDRGDPAAAGEHLRSALERSVGSDLTDLIRIRLAKVAQQLDDTDAALALLEQVRGAGYRSLVAELKGDIHFAGNERALAHEAYAAALDAVAEGDRRPVLELKLSTAAAAPAGLPAEPAAADGEASDPAPDTGADGAAAVEG